MREVARSLSSRPAEWARGWERLQEAFRIPSPERRVRSWHVSPAIDIAAYHFSWLWVLLPLLCAGPRFPGDYLPLFVGVLAIGFVHRHFTLGYAYLDGEIFARHRKRLIWTPAILGAALFATPSLLEASVPSGALAIGGLRWPDAELPLKLLVTAVVFGAGLWNIWHTLAQKYGILRIYNAKARYQGAPSVPPWVDRLFVLGWLPLIVAHVAPPLAEAIRSEFRIAHLFVEPILAGVVASAPIAAPISAAVAVASSAVFTAHEWRIHRFGNRPRLSMAIGIGSLWTCFLFLDPIKVYLAFAFSHGLEYMVFVWAYQRRRYTQGRLHRPLMARILERPGLAYTTYTLALAAIYVLLRDWQDFRIWQVPRLRWGGMKLGAWIFYWGVFQSLLHFYFDGFLWKTRRPEVRESL